jgi:plastocyanin
MARTWRRGLAVSAIVAAAWALAPSPAAASGGGGCGGPVTRRTGTSVRIDVFCFTPTVLRAPVGARVTFSNGDPFAHTVLGANGAWGSFEELGFEQSQTYRFGHAGVYSYVCTVHPGMSGAIVIGDPAAGPATAEVVPVEAAADIAPIVRAVPASRPELAGQRVWVLGIGVSVMALPLAWAVGRGQRGPRVPPES